jgi:hypothetical protein
VQLDSRTPSPNASKLSPISSALMAAKALSGFSSATRRTTARSRGEAITVRSSESFRLSSPSPRDHAVQLIDARCLPSEQRSQTQEHTSPVRHGQAVRYAFHDVQAGHGTAAAQNLIGARLPQSDRRGESGL